MSIKVEFDKCVNSKLFRFKPTEPKKGVNCGHSYYVTISGNFVVSIKEYKSMIYSRPDWVTHVESATLIEAYNSPGSLCKSPDPIFEWIILTTPSGERKKYSLNIESKCPLIIESVY